MKLNKSFVQIFTVIVIILTPLVILMFSIRLLINPGFARLAYRLPGFPEDPYGFSLQDRLLWSEPSIKYLVNAEDISYLANLTFENGEPIFNERELSHMEDVKDVVSGMRIALIVSLAILITITIFAVKNGLSELLNKAFFKGGWVVLGLIVAIILFVALNFNSLFTWFHHIFFESGTWQFHLSDTLIRLFPMRFWRDAFFLVGIQSVMIGGLVMFLTREKRK